MQAYPAFRIVLENNFKPTQRLTGIEIGVLGGGWTAYMLSYVPGIKKLYCIDPWAHFPDKLYERSHSQEVHEANFKAYNNKIKPFVNKGWEIITLRKGSEDAVADIKEPVDFVYIDGCHDYEFIKRDIANYYPLVKSGGIFGGHDYGLAGGVTRAVNEKFLDNDLHPRVNVEDDFVWWVKVY